MIFDHHKQPFDSDDYSTGKSQLGTNRLNKPKSSSGNKASTGNKFSPSNNGSEHLDLSELVKFWDAPQADFTETDGASDDLSLELDSSLCFKSSEQWDLLADALHKDTFFDGADSYFEYEHENPPWEEASTKCERVYALLSMAVLCREQDELAKSRSNLQQALREFLEFSHSEDQADADVQSLMGQIFLEMANQFLESDDLLSAYRFACHTVKLAYEIKEDSLYANAIATLGVIVGLDGQLDISFQLLSEAADRHREMEDHEGYIIDLMNLGELVSRDGMWETSATLLDQAIELSRQHECINLFLKASEIRNEVESIMRVKQTDPQRN